MANRIISGKNPKIVIPSFPIERVFHERQLRQSISGKIAQLDSMRAEVKTEKEVLVEHCMIGDEEMLLVSCGDKDGVAVAIDDLLKKRITLQQVCDSVI